MTAAEIAARIGATVVGDGSLEITGVAPLDRADRNELTFFADTKYAQRLRDSAAGAVILAAEDPSLSKVQLICKDPRLGLRGALLAFHRLVPEGTPGISPQAYVAATAEIDPSVQVGPCAVIESGVRIGGGTVVGAGCFVGEDSLIGKECYLYPNVTVNHHVTIEDRVILHSGVVLGADGFGYVTSDDGALKIPQVGGVYVEADVEIGANTTVDRATLGQTRIGKGTKVDNLVMIAHNVEIGEHCLIVSQVGIAGSTRVGNGVILAGQAGIIGHLEIGDGVTIGAQAGVTSDVPAGETYIGSPARSANQMKRIWAVESRLPDWVKRLRALEELAARIQQM